MNPSDVMAKEGAVVTEVQRRLRPLPTARPPRPTGSAQMAYSAYPLELYAREIDRGDGLAFGLRAARVLEGRHSDIVPVPTPTGLTLYARNEPALVAPAKRLLACFGDDNVRLSGPYVRCWPGTPKRWPIVTVQIHLPRLYATRVRFDLLDRGARHMAVEHGALASTIRAEVPQARLIGYRSWLGDVTGGLFELSVELGHYAALDVDRDFDDASAAPWPAQVGER